MTEQGKHLAMSRNDVIRHFYDSLRSQSYYSYVENVTKTQIYGDSSNLTTSKSTIEGSGVIATQEKARSVITKAIVGNFDKISLVSFYHSLVIPVSMYFDSKSHLFESFDDFANVQYSKSKISDRFNTENVSGKILKDSIDLDNDNYEKIVANNGGVGSLVVDSFSLLKNTESVTLTANFVVKYRLKLSQLLTCKISITELKVSGLASTFGALTRNLEFHPSDLLIDNKLLNVNHLQNFYKVGHKVLSSMFFLTPEDYLIQYHFSLMELMTLDFNLEDLFPSLKYIDKVLKIEESKEQLHVEWLKLKDAMNIFYRWYLTCNKFVLGEVTSLIPKINGHSKIETLSQYMEIVNVDSNFGQKNGVLAYLEKHFGNDTDHFDKWSQLMGFTKLQLKFIFSNTDDLFKVMILSTHFIIDKHSTLFDESSDKKLWEIAKFCNVGITKKKIDEDPETLTDSQTNIFSSGMTTPMSPMKTPSDPFKFDKKALTSRWFSHFVIVCRVTPNNSGLTSALLESKRPNKSWNVLFCIERMTKYCKKAEKDTGFRLLLSSELDIILNKNNENTKNFNVEGDQIRINQVLELISNDMIRTKLIPLEISTVMDYSLMHLVIGSPFNGATSIEMESQRDQNLHWPYKKNLGKKSGLVITDFGTESSIKETYMEQAEICNSWKDATARSLKVEPNTEIVLLDSYGLCELMESLEQFEIKLSNYLKVKRTKWFSVLPVGLFPCTLLATYSKKKFESTQKVASTTKARSFDSDTLNMKLQQMDKQRHRKKKS